MDLFSNVGWIGVIVGAVLAFMLGWAWYSPMLFGKQWAAGHNISLGSASSMPMAAMGSQALGLLLVAWFVGLMPAAYLAIGMATVGFSALKFSTALFSQKGTTIAWIDSLYWVAAVALIVIVQAVI